MTMKHVICASVLLAAMTVTVVGIIACGSAGIATKSCDGASSTAAPRAIAGLIAQPGAEDADELLIIERYGPVTKDRDDRESGLTARLPGEERDVAVPLEHTDVHARISAFVSSVSVTQRYRNPFDQKIEAVYVFPLPQDAAVTDFLMVIGDRKIRGMIREREEARRIYEAAKRQGKVASLLTQERPNIFTQSVANIEPGKRIDISITYFHTLPYRDGAYTFVFPMVVGPRFIPGASPAGDSSLGRNAPTAQVPDADRITPPALKPGERSGHDISVSVDIDAGVPLGEITCRSHDVDVDRTGNSTARVTLSPQDAIPDRDLVLRYRVAGEDARAAVLTNPDGDGGTFALVLHPPTDLDRLPRMPREMIFVLDCSGSMRGKPLDIAKQAIERCLERLGSEDTFQIIRFSEDASSLGSSPIAATRNNIHRGRRFLRDLEGTGGTMMIEGIKAALDFEHDERRMRIVSFWTDGFIGNEAQILAAIEKRVGSARLFSFGIGSSVNRYLLEGMARMGRGAVTFVGLNDRAVDAVDAFYRRACRPALADVRIDWGTLTDVDTYPRHIPDLLVGRPLLITGRYKGTAPTTIVVNGRVGSRGRALRIAVDPCEEANRHPALPKVWARRKIGHLSDLEILQPSEELRKEITAVSIRHGVQCRYTAFLAVDSLSETAGDHGVTVPVPVPVPDGVKYETTIGK
jgi:Ca-activated chloride channel homolog